ncbi:MAG TPA: helix-turn-helix domain-containing protein [Pirellulales bacterium]|nr:helix-turn-helix domain-containing protein [Pirellulales bacterium]
MKRASQIALSEEERSVLRRWSRGRSTPARLVLRARIVLAAAEGRMNRDIAEELGTSKKTVSLWRRRFAAGCLAGIEKMRRGQGARRAFRPGPCSAFSTRPHARSLPRPRTA